MKFLPDGIGRKLGSSSLAASENAPKLLFVGGVVGMVGSTVLACRATLKLEDVLDEVEADKAKAEDAKNLVNSEAYSGTHTYTDKEYKKDLYIITVRGVGKIARLYAPAVILGGVSIAALTKSHVLLKDRNLALTAAYAAVDGAYSRYRERVVERYGEEVDRELRYDTEQADIVNEKTGEVNTTTIPTDAPGAEYARYFDHESSPSASQFYDVNLMFVRQVQNWCNDRLKRKGHLFLNEVYDALGLSHTSAGAAVGWRWMKDSGDDYVDFGPWANGVDLDPELSNGREGAILLDFNVDGPIWQHIDEDKQR